MAEPQTENPPDKAATDAAFEEAELQLLRDGLRRSHTERFLFLMRLYKIGKMMQQARVTHQPDVLPKRN